jgi:chromate transporter
MTTSSSHSVRFVDAFWFWLKLGFISFGGPAGQIAVMHQELVERRRWISEKRFLHALNYCMLLPGPEAQQLATYIGWLMHKRWGGIVAGGLFVLPSLLIIVGLAWIYVAFGQLPVVAAVLAGIKPAVVAIVAQAVHRIGSRTLHHAALWAIALASFLMIFAFDVPFPWIVLTAACIGWLGSRRWPHVFRGKGGHGSQSAHEAPHAPAVIDDDTPTPDHALFNWRRLLQVVGVGLLLWALPLGLCALVWGWENNFVGMGWFFTKAALLTFGGAYAVLPYVYQGAVQHFGWLSAPQMMDGLALGETTPGPLIMVVTFVGFLGGYQQQWLGPDQAVAAGILAACWATWFTFLPSFVFILAGGPIVERTHGQLGFTAPLTAITAAVVGVVFNLALFFGWHVWWPQGWEGSVDVAALVLTGAALAALLVFKRSVIEVIGACALLGLMWHLGLAPLAGL